MKVPTATYRLQFRNGMTFETAEALVPYWRDLGISHLYASPIFTAATGSTHGYDVTDHNEIDPALGGREGFERLGVALREADMGIILDIVPNHMAASLENPWWRDIVQWGSDSRYAGHFDIDWSRPLTLPVLGRTFNDALQAGELSLVADQEEGTLALAYFDNRFPLHPRSWDMVLAGLAEDPQIRAIAELSNKADPAEADALRQAVRSLSGSRSAVRLSEDLVQRSRDAVFIEAIHQRQPWRLRFWKEASKDLSYRRFFEITGLVGLAVEKEEVFDDAHALVLESLRDGLIDGLRIDHVDGMADPGGYLRRLREKAGDEAYIVVEKILGPGEQLPPDWPVAGTTGYEFIEAVADLLVDPSGLAQISDAYQAVTGSAPTGTLRRQAKLQVITQNFEGELEQLVRLFARLDGAPERPEIRAALVQLLVAMPVYRTYGWRGPLNEADQAVVLKARKAAAQADPSLSPQALDFVAEVLISGTGDAALARTRFQQLSGPAMAKGVEDTLFYRDHRFLALNEVGGEPDREDFSPERFHAAMAERALYAPFAMTATATHDTKRGEDARARLYALAEAPDRWTELVERWRLQHRDHVAALKGGPAPEPEVEWMLYQALVGIWPDTLPADLSVLDDIRPRFTAYVEKVLREAKTRTSWTESDGAYEDAVNAYASKLLAPDNHAFVAEMSEAADPIRQAGWLNSLTQTLVKLTAPGVPDIYQGSEGGDFSLVDPDNRRPVDGDGLRRGFGNGIPRYSETAFKHFMIRRVLACRRAHPGLFSEGDCRPLQVRGGAGRHLVAFARSHGDEMLAVLAPRLTFDLLNDAGELEPDALRDLTIVWPERATRLNWQEMITGRRFEISTSGRVGDLLTTTPYALLMASH